MEKPAPANHPIHELIRRRWSPVSFSSRPVVPEDLKSLFEAARWAPSCYNDQPWHFIVATQEDPDAFTRMLSCLVPANTEWAQHAPVLVLAVARLNFAHNNKPNRHAFHDVGLALSNLFIQAAALGLFAHPMAGFSPEAARHAFDIPEGYEAITAVAIGYGGDAGGLSEALQKRNAAPRSRREIGSFVHGVKWGEAPLWLNS